MYITDLGQSLQDQSCFGSIAVLLVGFSLQPHLLGLCLTHCFNRGSLCLTDEADLLSLCLRRQHLLCPGEGLEKQQRHFTFIIQSCNVVPCVRFEVKCLGSVIWPLKSQLYMIYLSSTRKHHLKNCCFLALSRCFSQLTEHVWSMCL